jgi:hypothetical protein
MPKVNIRPLGETWPNLLRNELMHIVSKHREKYFHFMLLTLSLRGYFFVFVVDVMNPL